MPIRRSPNASPPSTTGRDRELRALVDDFFALKYPGSKIEDNPKIENSARVLLSEEAQRLLSRR